MKSKFLNLKEFVLVLLLACLETVIGLVAAMPFAANLQLVYFLVPGLTGLINGIIYVLLIKKCPKVGTQFIIPFVYGLLFLFSGSVYVFMFFAILAVANELIMIASRMDWGARSVMFCRTCAMTRSSAARCASGWLSAIRSAWSR